MSVMRKTISTGKTTKKINPNNKTKKSIPI